MMAFFISSLAGSDTLWLKRMEKTLCLSVTSSVCTNVNFCFHCDVVLKVVSKVVELIEGGVTMLPLTFRINGRCQTDDL